jgi:hypothetical protein
MIEHINVDGLDIPFDTRWNRIAISLSGGADSALLAYLICKNVQPNTKIHIISHIRMWKTKPWQQWDSLNVYNYLVKKFPDLTFKRHVNFIAPDLEYGNKGRILLDEYDKWVSGDNIMIRSFAEYVCFQECVESHYNAVSRNPKSIKLDGSMPERDLDPTEDNKHLQIMNHMGLWAIHPFRFIDKSWIIKQYRRLELEDLLNVTRSCEGEVPNVNYESYTPGQWVPVCNDCFWCKERAWAIEQTK